MKFALNKKLFIILLGYYIDLVGDTFAQYNDANLRFVAINSKNVGNNRLKGMPRRTQIHDGSLETVVVVVVDRCVFFEIRGDVFMYIFGGDAGPEMALEIIDRLGSNVNRKAGFGQRFY